MDHATITVLVDEDTDESRDVDVRVTFTFEAGEPGGWYCAPTGDYVEIDEDMVVIDEDGKKTGEVLHYSDLSDREQERATDEVLRQLREDAADAYASRYDF